MGLVGAACVAGLFGSACAHGSAARVATGSGGDEPARVQAGALSEGRYAVESIRSRATIDGVEQMIEISEAGSKMKDSAGGEHTITERGALTLGSDGACQLALAVSVDGDAPGVSERACTWRVDGEHFFLGEQGATTHTMYRVRKDGDHYLLEGLKDVGPDGKVVGDASGERIVLVEGRGPLGSQPASDKADTEDTSANAASISYDEI